MKKNLICFVFLLLTAAQSAHGFGSKPAKPVEPPPAPKLPAISQAKPYRILKMDPIVVPAFYFANGNRADFNVDLNRVIESEINSSRYFRTQISTPENSSRLVINGGISSFEAEVMQLNFKIGWNKNGIITIPGNNASGEVDLRLSTLSMDFMVYDRLKKNTVHLSSKTNENLSNLKIQVRVNLSNINGALDLFYKEVMAKAIAKATADILRNMENQQAFDTLPWESVVQRVDLSINKVYFNAGADSGLKEGDLLTVYEACTERGENEENCFPRMLADVRVEKVGANSAEAKPWTSSDSLQKIYRNDLVTVKPLVSTQR